MTSIIHESAPNGTPSLSIVIVNSNGAEDTLRCLDSVFRFPPRDPFEVILVDNCSEVLVQPLLAERFPGVRTYSSPAPQGFACNYNLGMRQARGAYVMILNNDTVVHAQSLDQLVDVLKEHPEYGMAGPRLVSADGKVQSSCARACYTPFSYCLVLLLFDLALPTGRLRESILSQRVAKRRTGPVPCINGACMVVSRNLLDGIGSLDEGYDFYFEDMEWCHRALNAGWQVAYIAEATVTHFGDQSLSKVKEWAKQSEFRSALRYFRQYHNLSDWQARLLWLATSVSFLLRMLAFGVAELVARRPGYARAYWHLFEWILRQDPSAVVSENQR